MEKTNQEIKKNTIYTLLFIAVALVLITYNVSIDFIVNNVKLKIDLPFPLIGGIIVLIIVGAKLKDKTINGKLLFTSSIVSLVVVLLSFLSYFLLFSSKVIDFRNAIPDKLMENVEDMNKLVKTLIDASTPIIVGNIILIASRLPAKIILLTTVVNLIEELNSDKNIINKVKVHANKCFIAIAMVTIASILLYIFTFRFINNISFLLNSANKVIFNINSGGYFYIVLIVIMVIFLLVGGIMCLIYWIKYLIDLYNLMKISKESDKKQNENIES